MPVALKDLPTLRLRSAGLLIAFATMPYGFIAALKLKNDMLNAKACLTCI